jgi:hypothetical protein
MNTDGNTVIKLSGNASRRQSIATTSLGATAINGWRTHPLEQAEDSALVNEACKVPEVSPQVDPMAAWDWSI